MPCKLKLFNCVRRLCLGGAYLCALMLLLVRAPCRGYIWDLVVFIDFSLGKIESAALGLTLLGC